MKIKRFGVSLEESVLKELDSLAQHRKFPNRSQAIRQLIKDAREQEQMDKNAEVAGALVLIYDHHKRNLSSRLTKIQHDHFQQIVSTQHIHLSQDICMEIIALRGKAKELTQIADAIISIKGVLHGKLVLTGLS